MPTGTGKTVCLLALILSFIKQVKPDMKLVYCTRTIVEMEKTIDELKFVQKQREADFKDSPQEEHLGSEILAMCLSSRRNLCIHPKVSKLDDRASVDSACRNKTAPWVAPDNAADIENAARCHYYDKFTENSNQFPFPKGVYNLEDLKALGKQTGMCPYFLARQFLLHSNIIVYSYAYMLDPKISNLVSAELQSECVVVFDECHNIDNACIEAMSLTLNRKALESASTSLKKLEDLIQAEKLAGSDRLKLEYTALVKSL